MLYGSLAVSVPRLLITFIHDRYGCPVSIIEIENARLPPNLLPPKSSNWDHSLLLESNHYGKYEPMKIAVMLRTLEVDQGISIYSINLMKSVLKLDRENEYLFMYADESRVGTFGSYPNLSEQVLPTKTKFIWDQVAVPRAAKRFGADIIFNTKFSVPLLSRAKSMLVLHGSEWYVHPEFYSRLDMIYNKILFPVYCGKASAISSVSQTSATDIIDFLQLDPAKVHVVYSSIAENFNMETDTQELSAYREKYDLPDKFILFVGKIYPGKNFGNIVRAFKEISDKSDDDIRLVSVGDMRWRYKPELQLVKELGLADKVHFPGWVDQGDLPAIYKLADCFLFPSYYEGFGIPLLESMACDCPVVTASIGSCPEIAADAALYADPNDPGKIAEQVLRVLSDDVLRQEMIRLGRERVKNFSWDRAGRMTIDIFEQIHAAG
jgi:glycosyltransferase involved in cell wall biosynthesis